MDSDRDRPGAGSVSRRAMIETTAAALAAPLVKVRVPGMPGAALGAAPRFLTPAEFALLDALSELIIPADEHSPGAHAAGVAAYLDGRLAESLRPEWQAAWRSGLGEVDRLSGEMSGKPFLQGSPEERLAVLARMAAGETAPGTASDRFFIELKRWTVNAYYTSETGIHADQEYKGNVYQPGEYAGYDAR